MRSSLCKDFRLACRFRLGKSVPENPARVHARTRLARRSSPGRRRLGGGKWRIGPGSPAGSETPGRAMTGEATAHALSHSAGLRLCVARMRSSGTRVRPCAGFLREGLQSECGLWERRPVGAAACGSGGLAAIGTLIIDHRCTDRGEAAAPTSTSGTRHPEPDIRNPTSGALLSRDGVAPRRTFRVRPGSR